MIHDLKGCIPLIREGLLHVDDDVYPASAYPRPARSNRLI